MSDYDYTYNELWNKRQKLHELFNREFPTIWYGTNPTYTHTDIQNWNREINFLTQEMIIIENEESESATPYPELQAKAQRIIAQYAAMGKQALWADKKGNGFWVRGESPAYRSMKQAQQESADNDYWFVRDDNLYQSDNVEYIVYLEPKVWWSRRQLAVNLIYDLSRGINTLDQINSGFYDIVRDDDIYQIMMTRVKPFNETLQTSPQWPDVLQAITAYNLESIRVYALNDDFKLEAAKLSATRKALINRMVTIVYGRCDN